MPCRFTNHHARPKTQLLTLQGCVASKPHHAIGLQSYRFYPNSQHWLVAESDKLNIINVIMVFYDHHKLILIIFME